jgi:hypothetical protein
MAKIINYNAIRTLTTPTMIKIYIILLIIGICYTFHYRNQMKGVMISDIKRKSHKDMTHIDKKDEKDIDHVEKDIEGFSNNGHNKNDIQIAKLEQEKRELTMKLSEYQSQNQFKLKKMVNKIKDDKKEIGNTLYQSSRDQEVSSKNYRNEISKLEDQFRKQENSKLVAHNKALSDYLDSQKKENYNINLLDIGTQVENGLVNLFEGLNNVISEEDEDEDEDEDKRGIEREGFIGTSSRRDIQCRNIDAADGAHDVETCTKDRVEAFSDSNNTKTNNNKKTKTKTKTNDSMDKAMGFFQYTLDSVLELIGYFSGKTGQNIIGLLLRGDNLIASGIIMLIVSVGLYFIDISS